MFICQACNKQSTRGATAVKIVTQTRPKNYPMRLEANRDWSDDKGGNGTEIVREIITCGCTTPKVN